MATPSSNLAWKIPWTEKPGRLQSNLFKPLFNGKIFSYSLALDTPYNSILKFYKMTYFYLIKIFSFFFNLKKIFFGGVHHMTCGILFPKLGIEPMPPTLEGQSLNQRIAREVLKCLVTHSFQRHQLSWNCVRCYPKCCSYEESVRSGTSRREFVV